MLSLCVFCASSPGNDPRYLDLVRDIGTSLGRCGIELVYGGGRTGLMGVIADAALAAGGCVTGVIPRMLVNRELAHPGITRLYVVESLAERKQKLVELAHASVALPGGIGTMDELFEAWTWAVLNVQRKPCGLLNAFGYYDELLHFLDRGVERGFLSPAARTQLYVEAEWTALLPRLLPMDST